VFGVRDGRPGTPGVLPRPPARRRGERALVQPEPPDDGGEPRTPPQRVVHPPGEWLPRRRDLAGAGRTLELPADRIALRDIALIGSVGYTKAVWSRMVGLVADRLVELDPIVTHRFPAADFRQAFDLLERREGTVAKVVLEHAA
jgi:hypothetical protein